MDDPKEDQNHGKSVFLSVTRPPDNPGPPKTSNVKTMGMGNSGTLCNAFGTATFPGTPFRYDGYYFKLTPLTSPLLTPAQVKGNPDKYLPCPNGSTPWDYSNQLAATGGNADNVFYAARSYCDFPMHSVVEFETTPIVFQGITVTSCTPLAAGVKAPASAASAAPLNFLERGPVDSQCEWLLYRELSAANFGPGNILMRHGRPLSARVLSIAACNVHWQHGYPVQQTTRRSFGDDVPGSDAYRFEWAPQNSIVLWQKSAAIAPRGTVIGSESREHPTTVYVDPHEEIRVQVNFALAEEFSRSGVFDLWVKVID